MKTPDETKKGLECCAASIYQCADDCPYREECRNGQGGKVMNEDALALIQQLQAENAKKDETIQMLQDGNASLMRMIDEECEKTVKLEAERDAAVACLKKAANEKGECFGCKWYNGKNCTHPDYKMLCSSHDDKWEWRGVQKEESTC